MKLIESEFISLLSDQESGSTRLILNFLEFLKKQTLEKTEIRGFISRYQEQYRHFTIIQNLTSYLVESDKFSNQNEIQKIIEDINISLERMLKHLKSKVGDETNLRILTISNSETLRVVLNGINPNCVFIMKSSPGSEGIKLQYSINYETELIEDSDVRSLFDNKKVNSVFMGCDSFNPNNWFINKIKSKELVQYANTHNIPVYLISSKYKQTRQINLDKKGFLEKISWSNNIILITDQVYVP